MPDQEPDLAAREADAPLPENQGEVDQVFADESQPLQDFSFNADVANAFDDMVSRSVPFYTEIQRIVGEMASDFAVPGSNVYDLGSATGTTLAQLDTLIHPDVGFVGIDNSDNMLDKARAKFTERGSERRVEWINGDLDGGSILIENASVVIMIFTLQFIRPLYREHLLQTIYNGMREDGVLLLAEKIISPHTLLNRLFINHYYNYKKRRGYSEVEIARKREALENVLVPYRYEENEELLKKVGFRHVEETFRWYNFCSMVAVK